MTKAVIDVKISPPFRDSLGRFRKATDETQKALRAWLREQGRRLVDLVQEEAPKKSGDFARGHRFQTRVNGKETTLTVTAENKKLAGWILKGTRAHIIVPRKAKALRFVIGDTVIFAKKVHHPGTNPNKYIGRAYRRWQPGIRSGLKEVGGTFTRTFSE